MYLNYHRNGNFGYVIMISTTITFRLGLLLEEYLHRIDPDMALGVDSYSSIVGYQIIINDTSEDTCVIRTRNEVIGSRISSKFISKKGSTAAEDLSPADVITSNSLIRIRLSGK